MSERDKPTDKPVTDKPVHKADTTVSAKTTEAISDEPFLQRWSRLKSDDASGESEGGATGESGEAETALAETGDDAPAIDPADLPDIESLNKDSDYSVFMQEGVPDALRNLALRKLFMSNPMFSVLDGLNDYDEDYSMIGIVSQKVTTAYKAGRGFLEDSDLVNIDEPVDAAQADAGEADDDDDVGDGDVDDGDIKDGEGDAAARIAKAEPGESASGPELSAVNDAGDLEPAKAEVAGTASSVRKPDKDGNSDA
ncbi:MAG: DUF3306 domain-containing protein [Alphaproteobacteria bacterium]|nr:DUF3306 domain-containing protein [Alphaproteobacteria bacterium]